MRTLTQRVTSLERAVRQIRRDIAGVEREMRERTRPTSRIGFEVFDEQDWEIGDAAGRSEIGRNGRGRK